MERDGADRIQGEEKRKIEKERIGRKKAWEGQKR